MVKKLTPCEKYSNKFLKGNADYLLFITILSVFGCLKFLCCKLFIVKVAYSQPDRALLAQY